MIAQIPSGVHTTACSGADIQTRDVPARLIALADASPKVFDWVSLQLKAGRKPSEILVDLQSAPAAVRIYTVCRVDTRELVMRVEAESDYDARYLVTRLTSWPFDALTTRMKAACEEPA